MNNTTSLTKMHHKLVAVTAERDRLAAELQKLREQLFGADGWEVNARYVLDRCKHTVRMCEGGGPENLIGSLILTFTKMEGMLDGTVAAIAAPESNRERAARIVARWPKWKSNWRLTRHSPKAESELVEAGGCASAVIAAPSPPEVAAKFWIASGECGKCGQAFSVPGPMVEAAPSVPEEWRKVVSDAAYHLEQHALEYKHPGQHKLIAELHALLQSAEVCHD